MFSKSEKNEKIKQEEMKSNIDNTKYFYELSKHYIIKISLWQKTKLFFSRIFNSDLLNQFFGNKKLV